MKGVPTKADIGIRIARTQAIKRRKKKLREAPLWGPGFEMKRVSLEPLEALKVRIADIEKARRGLPESDQLYWIFRRRLRWLNERVREIHLFRRMRDARGAPQDKEARRDVFARAFYEAARGAIPREEFERICKMAAISSGLVEDDPTVNPPPKAPSDG
jgi:hypothetical protein